MNRREDESNWAHACRVFGLDSHGVSLNVDAALAGGDSATRRSRNYVPSGKRGRSPNATHVTVDGIGQRSAIMSTGEPV